MSLDRLAQGFVPEVATSHGASVTFRLTPFRSHAWGNLHSHRPGRSGGGLSGQDRWMLNVTVLKGHTDCARCADWKCLLGAFLFGTWYSAWWTDAQRQDYRWRRWCLQHVAMTTSENQSWLWGFAWGMCVCHTCPASCTHWHVIKQVS